MNDRSAIPARSLLILAALVGLLTVPWSVPGLWHFVVRPIREHLDDRQLTVFAQRIAAADRVVALRRVGANSSNELRITLSGEDAKRIVQAVSSAKADRKRYKNMYLVRTTFFSGPNIVGEIRMDDACLFMADGRPYRDVSCSPQSPTSDGTLCKLITAPLVRMAQEAALRPSPR